MGVCVYIRVGVCDVWVCARVGGTCTYVDVWVSVWEYVCV